MLSSAISLSLLVECVANMAKPRLATTWNHLFPRYPEPDYTNIEKGVWPYASDFSPPEDNWGNSASDANKNQIIFFAIYCSFWVLVVVLVKFWPSISKPFTGTATNDRAQPLLDDSNEETNYGEKPDYPHDRRVFEQLDDRIQEDPSSCAFILPAEDAERKELSYSHAGALIDEVAKAVNDLGATTGSVVALCMQRSVAQPVAMFGVLKSGAGFLPVDAEQPNTRKSFLFNDVSAAAVIHTNDDPSLTQLLSELGIPSIILSKEGKLGALQVNMNGRSKTPVERVRPATSDLALLLYTSGTTGEPKGIMYDHKHLTHGVHFFNKRCEVTKASVGLLKSPYFWGVMEWEFFPCLTAGGKLVVTKAQGHKSPEYLVNMIKQEKVDNLFITPSVLDLVLDIADAQASSKPLISLKHVVCCGEPLACSIANRFMKTRNVNSNMYNYYAATETNATVYSVPREGINLSVFPNKAPAGVPDWHVNVFVMNCTENEDGTTTFEKVPTGESGEICFGGVLAAGYWKLPELTKKKFIESKEYGTIYRSGDLGRFKCGVLEVVGRTDRQVKIRGVRIEPEEVEMCLKKFSNNENGTPSLKQVAVVASAEPASLVAFASAREGAGLVTSDMLKAHCQSNLTPAYVPKYFVVLDELPCLPNGKPNLREMKEMATQHADEEGEVVMDSLGQMKKMSSWAIMEQNIIHRCYAFWMIGVLVDHYNRCASDMEPSGLWFQEFCSPVASKSVAPWAEVIIRSLGNDQDMFGFIMLGAYQDSRPQKAGDKPKVKFGLKDLFVFTIYMAMAVPFGPIMHYIFGSWATPVAYETEMHTNNWWGWDYMRVQSYQSDHRWYLLMVLQARLFMQICEYVRLPGWSQILLTILPLFGPTEAMDVCADGSTSSNGTKYIMSWIFRNFGSSCPVYVRWFQIYLIFYVACFHYLRPLVDKVKGKLPTGATWSAAAGAASMCIGVMMGLWHYPNYALENGLGLKWIWWEMFIDFAQPSLFALAMANFPFNMAWWGNTTLGCYTFHFYFRDAFTKLFLTSQHWFTWDPTGMLFPIFDIGICCLFTTFIGPLCHYLLLSPTFLYQRVQKMRKIKAAEQAAQTPGKDVK